MSTGDTAASLVAAQPRATTHSDSTMSSPLSEVKDAYPDEMDEDHSDLQQQPNDASDSTSNLSDIHSPPPESEAETDRLYDTPRKPIHHKDVFLDQNNDAKVLERSPSKLQQEVKPENVIDKDERSLHTSELPSALPAQTPSEPQSPSRNPTEADAAHESAEKTDTESRKRKRSVGTDNSEPDEPLKKRTGPVGAADHDSLALEPTGAEDTATVQSRSGDHSTVEEEPELGQDKDDELESVDHSTPEDAKLKKRKRYSTKGRKATAGEASADVEDPSDGQDEESGHQPDDDNGITAEEDQMDVDGEEEPDSAHKNEEEFERKKMAYDRLSTIEQHFTAFRDRLFAERLEQLNKEEAMLKSDSPSHPDYLAMMRCLDARLEEKVRYADRQLQYDMESLNRSTVARRSQIMAQYHQGIRESREAALEDLGQQWYEIQHERRRHAGTVPEYGIKYPIHKSQQIRDAVAYNREVSILSGIAKYRGFPAAPDLNGATQTELEDDLEIISRSRQPAPPILPTFSEYGVSSKSLGPAGEQFLEQTPWANPNHPAHHQPRHHSLGGPSNDSPLPKRQAVQHNPFAIHGSVLGLSNGQMSHKPSAGNRIQPESLTAARSAHDQHPKGGPNAETGRSVKTSDLAVKRETMAQATVA